jgi:porin
VCAFLSNTSAKAEEEQSKTFSYEVTYTADVIGALRGGAAHAGRYLDNLDLIGDLDLERAAGWRGATLHGYALNNSGGQPNAVVGTLEGVDNIEVSRARLRLYELWLEQNLGEASLKLGLYDLNSEFYVTDAAGLFISPPFGIGSEFASTGPNGPSIFPSTTLAVRFRYGGETGAYAQAAVLNADAGTIGDPHGLDMGLDHGALVVAEVGYNGPTRVALGAWRYTDKQDDLRDLDPFGAPVQRTAQGGYGILEHTFVDRPDGPRLRGFLRVGASDGDTTPFEGGWQTGLFLERAWPGRPDSAAAIGLAQGLITAKHRTNGAAAGLDLGPSESRVEATYSDRIGPVTLQPDVQFIHHPGGDRSAKDAVVAALRMSVSLH